MDLLSWLTEHKSDRVRTGTAFGCVATAALGIPLVIVLLAFGAIPHCQTCASDTGDHLLVGLALAGGFGVLAGLGAAFARPRLQSWMGTAGSVMVLAIGVAILAYLSLSPALKLITQ